MRAIVGDELTVRGRRHSEDRHGTIIEVHGRDGSPPYLVCWRDGWQSMFYPAPDVAVEHHPVAHAVAHPVGAGCGGEFR